MAAAAAAAEAEGAEAPSRNSPVTQFLIEFFIDVFYNF